MATASPDDPRLKLAELGRRRREHDANGVELSDDIRKALVEAKGVVTLAEAAELLGVHRTTIYRVYKS
jgi:transcriptional regulator of acetoin/glycerol metabolism